MAINQKYSFKDFTGQTFTGVGPAEFSNSEIKGSCFYQENEPDKIIFPAGMTGVVFQRCNLDNVLVLPVSTMDDRCSNRRIMVQNDRQDWVVDVAKKPVEPLSLKFHAELDLSPDPVDIPADLIREERVTKSEYDAATKWTDHAPIGNKPPVGIDFWFKEKPAIIETTIQEEVSEVRGWNRSDAFHFDSLPTLVQDKGTTQIVTGTVTRYLIRGKAWRYRGE